MRIKLHLQMLFVGLLFLAYFFGSGNLHAQNALDREVSGKYDEVTLIEVLLDIESRYPPIKFYYDPAVLPYYKVTAQFQGSTLFAVLQKLLPQHNLTTAATGAQGIVILKKSDLNRAYITNLVQKWEAGKVELPEFLQPYQLTLVSGTPPASTERTVAVTLRLADENSLEPVPGAVVRISAMDSLLYTGPKGATTNSLGLAKMQLAPGFYSIKCSYLGYRETLIQLTVHQGGNLDVPMKERLENLKEVVIQGNKAADRINNNSAGLEALPTQTIREMPALMGEADLVKSLSILPGVSTTGEGTAGFNVRGGTVDQNLILQDGMPIFNTSHVLGFFSVFNPDLVGTTTLYKGHIPASYGGRVASVLDVQLRSPNYQSWHGNVGAGIMSAKASIEGPLIKNKIAILAGVRTSYSDWLLRSANLPDVNKSSARFSDGQVKLSMRIGERGTLEVGGHQSSDFFRFAREFGYTWSTTGFSMSHQQAFSKDLSMNVQVATSNLKNNYFVPDGFDAFDLSTAVRSTRARAALSWLRWEQHEIKVGAEWNRTATQPQSLQAKGESSGIAPKTVNQDRGEEFSLFVEDEWKLTEKVSLYGGLRYTAFRQIGAGEVFNYENGQPVLESTIRDTQFFSKNKTMQQYGGFEPRIAVSYQVVKGQSIKLSYNRMRQYVHLISNSTAATPADLWQVSNRYIPPQIADNFSIGYFRNLDGRNWETSVEGFYKKIENLPAYRNFAELLLNPHIETELINGRMRSYGAEYSLRKKTGRLTGSLSYTWSRSLQQAKSDEFPIISVNKGKWFAANFDQPHQVNLYVKWARNPSRYWTANFAFRSGRPVAAPENGYNTELVVVPYFPARNNQRIPNYHRLDLGYTIDRSKSKLGGVSWLLNFSIYNVYARQNPFAVYFKRDGRGIPKAYQLSAIGTALPSVNFTLVW